MFIKRKQIAGIMSKTVIINNAKRIESQITQIGVLTTIRFALRLSVYAGSCNAKRIVKTSWNPFSSAERVTEFAMNFQNLRIRFV